MFLPIKLFNRIFFCYFLVSSLSGRAWVGGGGAARPANVSNHGGTKPTHPARPKHQLKDSAVATASTENDSELV